MYKVLIVEDEMFVRVGICKMIHWSEMDMEVEIILCYDGNKLISEG